MSLWRHGGVRAVQQRVFTTANYDLWVELYDAISEGDRSAIAARIQTFSHRPVLSILLPVSDPSERALLSTIESVRRQLYPLWELCVAGDASASAQVGLALEATGAARDERIRSVFGGEMRSMSTAANSALELATGEFVGLIECGDEVAEHGLYMAAEQLQAALDADLIYSDEDSIDEIGRRFAPHFKSDWNLDLFLSQNAIGGLCMYRTSLVREASGFRPAYEGSHDYDLALRVTERTEAARIRHIPHVLYHRRANPGSKAPATSGPDHAAEVAKKSVEDHLRRRGIAADVFFVPGTSFRHIRYRLNRPEPLVSVIVPTRDRMDLLKRCVAGVLADTAYANLELLIVDNGSVEAATKVYLREIEGDTRVRVIEYLKSFNYSAINNFAVRQARGEVIVLLNNDTEVISGHWLSEMVANAMRPEVGAVGARLLYPDGTLQHAGTVVGMGFVAGHVHSGISRDDPGYFSRAMLQQNLSAVTAACLAIRGEVFEEVGGLDEELRVAFNDVDLCLRIRQRGYLIVYTPLVELYHHESASRGSDLIAERRPEFEREIRYMAQRWAGVMANDPYYNPNLSLFQASPVLAFPPRQHYPWRSPSIAKASPQTR
jgi:O-antigen biosynthesis protein